MEALKKFDLHPKTRSEFKTRTISGALASVWAVVSITYLVLAELRYSRQVRVVDRLWVNSTHGAGVNVSFDLEFPGIACDLVSVDAMDQSGQPMRGVWEHVYKKRVRKGKEVRRETKHAIGNTLAHEHELTKHKTTEGGAGGEGAAGDEEGEGGKGGESSGDKCGDCYGALPEGECCNSCEDVRGAYRTKGWQFPAEDIPQCQKEGITSAMLNDGDTIGKALAAGRYDGEGCIINGQLGLTSVAGNFHFAPGEALSKAEQLSITELVSLTFAQFNISHRVRTISFGERLPPELATIDSSEAEGKERNLTSQLDGTERIIADGYGMYQYYLKVVPTLYKPLVGDPISLYQYSVTEHMRHVTPGSGRGLPGVFFFYEMSPLCAVYEEKRKGWLPFFVSLCAIIGGIYATGSVVDQLLHELLTFVRSRLKGSRGVLD